MDWAANALSEEGQELVASLMLEPYGVLVDDLAATMADRDPPPRLTVPDRTPSPALGGGL